MRREGYDKLWRSLTGYRMYLLPLDMPLSHVSLILLFLLCADHS